MPDVRQGPEQDFTEISRNVHGPGNFQGVLAACFLACRDSAGLEGLGLGLAVRQSGIF
jgi:hypothetical protein